MASNVFPMLSSSPPPMDDCPDDDDDDDEFGNFASANIPFDSSFDSPVASDKFKAFKTDENGANDINLKNDLNKFHYNCSETPPLKEFVHSFSEIQSNEGVSCKSDIDELPFENNSCFEHSSSPVIEYTTHKNNFVSSHNFVPDECDSAYRIENSGGAWDDSDSIKSFDLPNCSNDGNVFENESVNSHVQGVSQNKETWKPFPDANNELSDRVESKKIYGNEQNCLSEVSSDILTDKKELKIEKFKSSSESIHDTEIPSSNESPCKINELTVESCSSGNYCCSNSEDFDEFKQPGLEYDIPDNLPTSSAINFAKFSEDSNVSAELSTSAVLNQSSSDLNSAETFHQHHYPDDFDDFQSSGKPFCDSDNADLQNCTSHNNLSDCDDIQNFENITASDQEFNDFADFQDFSKAETSVADDFADFETAPFESNKQLQQSESCEFADFESAQFSSSGENSSALTGSCPASAIVQEKSVDKLSTVINTIFPTPDGQTDVDDADEPVSEILEQSNKSRRLWEKLHEIDQTPGLRFQWGVSHSFQQLLRSVNVDYHSILRTSSVPIFASSLSLLEPVKGHSSSANYEPEDRNLSPKDPIPPVEFDWNSSGLVNPLDSVQAASTLMDLSFLSSTATDGSITSGDHSFENELLKPSPMPSYSESSEKPHILEQLLSKNVSSLPNSKVSHRPSNLSEEAVRVLDQLPDLSFMQAKVLMFPISSKT